MMNRITRRDFLKSAVAAGLATAVPSRALGANDEVRVAVVGLNGRGGSHIRDFNSMKGVKVVALCDVDANVLQGRARGFDQVEKYQDVRKMLENKNIDAVSVATTNHSHSLITIWSCQAGKDVYVEKPCSHNVFEGRKCVEAARKYKRIVQHGTQGRSEGFAKLAAIVKKGVYGKLLVSKGYCCKPRWSIGFKPFQSPPANLDFDLWLGPAPLQPYHANLVHYNWHWFWDFGNGDIGNQGVHEMDKARWATGKTLPRSVVSLGGRWVEGPGFRDQGETPNQLVSIYDYGDSLILFETRGLVGKDKKFPDIVTNELYFEEGAIKGDRFYPKGKDTPEPLANVDYQVYPGGNFGNFINCVRSRKVEELNADILEAHYSSALCHLGNISYRMGIEMRFGMPENFTNNTVLSDSVMTMLENTKAIGVIPENTTLCVGPKLEFDPEKEKFVNNPAADMFLTRPYRSPFVVPEQV
ncbi:MAG: Gfo/Idh/MocA family oxidoreductase [bacterium]|nr:Gfo/Idh/MocA family oxidoreductase [bacterium]